MGRLGVWDAKNASQKTFLNWARVRLSHRDSSLVKEVNVAVGQSRVPQGCGKKGEEDTATPKPKHHLESPKRARREVTSGEVKVLRTGALKCGPN